MLPFKLQFVSDLHLELRKSRTIPTIQPIQEGKTYLALCGDIGNPFLDTYREFIDIHSELFAHILIVSGNHEYYTSNKQRTMRMIDEEIYKICRDYDNVTYLNMDRIIIGRTKFIGCTLWSDVSNITNIAESIMNDYKRIWMDSPNKKSRFEQVNNGYRIQKKYIREGRRRLQGSDVADMHSQMKSWLETQIANYNPDDIGKKYDNIIVLTHHAPSFAMLEKSDLYSPCYGSECDYLMGPPITYWISGHTHVSKRVIINGTTLISNCMGYPGQKVNGYNPNEFITFQ
jgi:predicted phosphohydrolase